MSSYDPSWTLRRARARYFQDNDFGEDGGYGAWWVTIYALGPLKLGFPNTTARVSAVRYHDLHHLVTGYGTDLIGESEISAWELGSGCRENRAAWVLNSVAVLFGVLRERGRTERAFARGCRSRNLYAEAFGPALLDENLGAMRERLRVDETGDAALTPEERAQFRRAIGRGALGVVVAAGLTIALLTVIIITLIHLLAG